MLNQGMSARSVRGAGPAAGPDMRAPPPGHQRRSVFEPEGDLALESGADPLEALGHVDQTIEAVG
jgi:hypothetical protein